MAKEAPSLDYLSLAPAPDSALAVLSEPLRPWFRQRFGEPTPGQRLAWPTVHAGRNLLLIAPTGSGKTLAAFLPILDRLLVEPLAAATRCLYVAPLKALIGDVRRNLRDHLAGVEPHLPAGCPPILVAARTGDTSSRARRQMLLAPPDILLTTPESLAVMLLMPGAAGFFGGLRWLVLDEAHALAGSKRGADLSLSLERLEDLAGGLQRIGLSATCAPPAVVARFVAGAARACTVAQVPEAAPLQLQVEPLPEGGGFCQRLLARLRPELEANRTTLVFTNVRSLTERLAWALKRDLPEWSEQIAVHHSSLAAKRRRLVERRLKAGALRVVVSSTSLELGIDVGHVDGVVLVHPPGGVVRLLQRVGRGGHGPGRPRRGLVLTASSAELLEAAVTTASGTSEQYEPIRLPVHPLDVLCQQLLGLAAQGWWDAEQALALARRAAPYSDLSREDLDDCLAYLSGRRRDGRDWLPARLRWEGNRFTIADERTLRLLRRNLGTIITEEPRSVRLQEGGGVGQVDEPFADRLQPGDRFLLDGRCLEFKRVEKQALLVEEVMGRPVVPRWAGDAWPCSAGLARRLYLLRQQAAEALTQGPQALAELLREDYGLGPDAAAALVDYFRRQEALSEIPDARSCLVECVRVQGGVEYYLHTPLNRAGNDALARVAAQRLLRERGRAVASVLADLGFLLCVPGDELQPTDFRELLRAADFDADLERAVADSLTLRERFQRVALVGLMLLRNPLGARRKVGGHDWAERRLFDQVRAAEPEFVLLRQALHEVREESLDAPAARAFAEELPRHELRCRWLLRPSPFAGSWTQTLAGPVETADDQAAELERLHAELLLPEQPGSTITSLFDDVPGSER